MKFWLAEKGFGFIRPDLDGEDLFVHSTELLGCDKLAKGARVSYQVGSDPGIGKSRAIRCRLDVQAAAPSMISEVVEAPREGPKESEDDKYDTWQLELLEESDSEPEGSEKEDEEPVDEPQQENELEVSPSEVFFTHDRISPKFRTGTLIDEVIDQILMEKMSFADFPQLICTKVDDKVYSLNNRRLFVARVLEKMEKIQLIRVILIPLDHPYLQKEEEGSTKWKRSFTTTNQGLFVSVRSEYWPLQRDNMARRPHRRLDEDQCRSLKTLKCEEFASVLALKPVILFQKAASQRDITLGANAPKIAQEAKWHLEERVPKELMNLIGREYGIAWEVVTHPSHRQVAGIKLIAKNASPENYSEGVKLLKETVAKSFPGVQPKTVLSLSSPKTLSAQTRRAAEKQRSVAKLRR